MSLLESSAVEQLQDNLHPLRQQRVESRFAQGVHRLTAENCARDGSGRFACCLAPIKPGHPAQATGAVQMRRPSGCLSPARGHRGPTPRKMTVPLRDPDVRQLTDVSSPWL
jgi:hypothetical protein